MPRRGSPSTRPASRHLARNHPSRRHFLRFVAAYWPAPLAGALAILASPGVAGAQTAFSGAVGFGAGSTGARASASPTIYHVTNLNDSGAGSFRDAVSASNRIIVFDVGGYINLTSAVSAQSNLTILGQTAPGGGIAVKGAEVSFYGRSNDIVRYFRFRDGINDPDYTSPSSTSGSSANCLNLGNTNNMVFDHVSAEFAAYNNVDAAGTTGCNNVTFQNSIVADPIASQRFNFHWEGGGDFTNGWGRGTFINNIFANSHNRSILAKGNTQYVNNIIYNYEAAFTTGNSSGTFNFDILNNYFVAGPNTSTSSNDFYQVDTNQSAYAAGNMLDSNKNGVLDGSSDNSTGAIVLPAAYFGSTQFLPTLTPAQAYAYAIAHAGPNVVHDAATYASSRGYDQIDSTVISDVTSLGTSGQLWTSETQSAYGGMGTIATGAKLTDTDNDGIPDAWETAHGLNPAVADSTLRNPLGRTMIEQWADEIADTNASATWTASSGNWTTAANWTGTGSSPTAYDHALVRGNGAGTNGLVTVNGTGLAAFDLSIGGNGDPAGEKVLVSGGSLTITDTIKVGDQNNGLLQIDSGSVYTPSIQLGNSTFGAGATTWLGTLTLNNGILRTAQIMLGGGTPGNWNTGGSVVWNGGTIQAIDDTTINAPIALNPGGGTFDSNGNNATMSGSLSGAGTLTKTGAGILVLTGNNSHAATVLQGGEVGVTSDANLGGTTTPITFAGGLLQINSAAYTSINTHPVNWTTFNGGFDINAAMNFTFSQSISGPGTLTLTGTGSLTVTGANAHTGGTVINGGNFIVTADHNLGAVGSPLTLNGGRFRVNGTSFTNLDNHPFTLGGTGIIDINTAGNVFTINQSIGGSGGLTKAGAGVLVLNANNSFSGTTTVSAGTLRLANAFALRKSTLSLTTAGVAVDFAGISPTLGGLSGNQPLDLQGLTVSVGNNNGTTTFSGVISNSLAPAGGLVKIGTGSLTLSGSNTYTTPTTLSAGTVDFSNAVNGGLASPLGASSSAAGNLILDGGTLEYVGAGQTFDRLFTLTAKGGGIDGAGTGGIAFGNTGTVLASGTGSRTLTLGGAETHGNYAFDIADPVGGVTSLAKNDAGRWLISGAAKTYSGDTLVNAGTLMAFGSSQPIPHGAGKGNLVVASGAIFETDNNNVATNALKGAGNVNTRTGSHVLTVGDGDASGTFSGSLTNSPLSGSSTLSLTKIGAGTQILSGTANTYGGATIVSGGVLQFAAAGSIGGTGASVTVNAAGTSAAGYAIDQAFLNRMATGSTGVVALAATSSGALSFASYPGLSLGAVAAQTYNGALTPNGTTYRLGGGGGSLAVYSLLSGGNAAQVGVPGSGGTVTLANLSNSYTGPTTITNAILAVSALPNGGAAGPIGASTSAAANLVLDGGTLRLSSGNATSDRLFTLTANGGTLDDSAGDFGFSSTGPIAFTGSGSRTLTLTGSSATNHGALTQQLSDPSGGQLTLLKTGAGRWFFGSNANTYSGDTVINGGSVYTGVDNAIPSGAGEGDLNVISGTFEFYGHNQAINGLNGAGTVDNNGSTRTLTLGNGDASGSFGGQLTGAIALAKVGAGNQAFTAPITLSTQTTISGGTLEFAGAGHSLAAIYGTGGLVVDAGATLASDGVVAGSLAVAGSHLVRPGGGSSKVNALSIAGSPSAWTGHLEIANNALIVQSADGASKAAALSTLLDQIQNTAGGTTGLTSASVAADPSHVALFAVDNALLGATSFGGLGVDGNSILVEATYKGDANLDRKVDVIDLGVLATNYGTSTAGGITKGDYNGDGKVDVIDLGILATDYGLGTSGAAFNLQADMSLFPQFAAAVPEPGSLALLSIFTPLLLRRRRSA